MEKRCFAIENIPAVLWGPASDRLFIAAHGDQSHKADTVIQIFAGEAVRKGYQVLSFDLPEHGERKAEARLCKAQHCVEDLRLILQYTRARSGEISLFGCSMGAYIGMLACKDEPIRQALFVSPVVDMERIIRNLMAWFDVSEERLEREREIATPIKTLYWDYYQYVLAHPVEWNKPTALLYGANDALCALGDVERFAACVHAGLTILEDGEHYFHTEKQLAFLRKWLSENIGVSA